MYNGIIRSISMGKAEKTPSYAEHVMEACINTGLDTVDQAQKWYKKHDEVIFVDDNKDNPKENLVRGVFVKKDPVHVPESVNNASPEEEGKQLGCDRQHNILRESFSQKIKVNLRGVKLTLGYTFHK
jgi:hypothetical protein